MTASDDGVSAEALAALAVDYWKLLRAFDRAIDHVPPERARRLEAQSRFSATRLDAHLSGAGLELAVFDGREITPEIPVIAINAEECSGAGRLLVGDTVEPAVIAGPRVLALSRVVAVAGDA